MNTSFDIKGWWSFYRNHDDRFADMSGNENPLMPNGSPQVFQEKGRFHSISLDGATQWLSTGKTVLDTSKSFSVAAWVRLDKNIMSGKLTLKPGEHALTAVSQNSPTHSAFYLGVREINHTQLDGELGTSLRWNFTVTPVDSTETGVLQWQHAYTHTPLDDSILDQWVFLVGVCDVSNSTAHIYVPSANETGIAYMPKEWSFWQANEGLQIGRGKWLGRTVDQWPGQIGPVRACSGILTADDVQKIYEEDSKENGFKR